MTNPIAGGCHCGAVRYRITGEPSLQQFCYCTDCTKIGGTDGYAGYIVDSDDFEVTQGETSAYTLTSARNSLIHRHFCGTCGTRLFADVENFGGIVSVAAGTFDDPSLYAPIRNNRPESAPPWARFSDRLANDADAPPPPARPASI